MSGSSRRSPPAPAGQKAIAHAQAVSDQVAAALTKLAAGTLEATGPGMQRLQEAFDATEKAAARR